MEQIFNDMMNETIISQRIKELEREKENWTTILTKDNTVIDNKLIKDKIRYLENELKFYKNLLK